MHNMNSEVGVRIGSVLTVKLGSYLQLREVINVVM